jgi:hypothetical protein
MLHHWTLCYFYISFHTMCTINLSRTSIANTILFSIRAAISYSIVCPLPLCPYSRSINALSLQFRYTCFDAEKFMGFRRIRRLDAVDRTMIYRFSPVCRYEKCDFNNIEIILIYIYIYLILIYIYIYIYIFSLHRGTFTQK